MKKLIFAGACTILLALNPVFSIAQERIGDFSLLDDQGYFHHMAWYDDHAVIALLVGWWIFDRFEGRFAEEL